MGYGAVSAPLAANHICVEIRVTDTGIGIAPADQQRIFEAFTQSQGHSNRKFGGTGLGLAITRRLVIMMGGTITLESQLGQGSTFILQFPDVAIAASPAIAHPQKSASFSQPSPVSQIPHHQSSSAATPTPQATWAAEPTSALLLPELLSHCQRLLAGPWAELHRTMVLSDLETFIVTLQGLYDQYGYPPLGSYLQQLGRQLDDFDWENRPQTVQSFETLVAELCHHLSG